MTEGGGMNGPPPLPKKEGFEGETVEDFRKFFSQKVREATAARFGAAAVDFLKAGEERLQAMDEEGTPHVLERMIFNLKDDFVRYMTELDVAVGHGTHQEMSDSVNQPIETAPDETPPHILGTISRATQDAVMNRLATASQFVEVADKLHEERRPDEDFRGSMDAACTACWSAFKVFYDGMVQVADMQKRTDFKF